MKASSLKKMKMNSAGQFQTQSNAIVSASYAVSLQVAKAKKPHNIAETLIKPCLVECAGILLGESAKSKIKMVSLSNNTAKSRIADIACDITSQLIENIKVSPVFGIRDVPIPHFKPIPIILPIPAFRADTDTITADTTDTFSSIEHHQ